MIPEPWQFVLLALIAFRVWRLLAEDDILERPRRRLLRLSREWADGDPIPRGYRNEFALFLTCPWCLGAWVSLAMYVVWVATLGEGPDSVSDVVIGAGVWFALSASVGLIRTNLDPPE